MSRIGKLPVSVPNGVSVQIEDGTIKVSGPKGELTQAIPPRVEIVREGETLYVRPISDDRIARSMHGLTRSLLANLVTGVHTGFSKSLEIIGVGYRVESKKDYLVFTLGYSHPIYYELPGGVVAKIESPTKIAVSGPDRQKVGAAAAKIRSFRPPEPYKGKGVKYADEVIRRKEGKSGGR